MNNNKKYINSKAKLPILQDKIPQIKMGYFNLINTNLIKEYKKLTCFSHNSLFVRPIFRIFPGRLLKIFGIKSTFNVNGRHYNRINPSIMYSNKGD